MGVGPGEVLNSRYELTDRIGGGSMGEVWRGRDLVLGRTVAVKIVLPNLLETPTFLERFAAEARVMAMIDHPGVISVYDYGYTPAEGGGLGTAFMVMEFIDGESLDRILARLGPLEPGFVLETIVSLLDALAAVHRQGVVHRDIKPGNVMLRQEGVVLADFGIARSAESLGLTAADKLMGTVPYLAPELFRSEAPATPAADVYAVGVLAFELLDGLPPFHASTTAAVMFKHVNEPPPPLPEYVPAEMVQLLDRALAKNPADRWADAAAMAVAVRAVLAGGSVPEWEPVVAEPVRRRSEPGPGSAEDAPEGEGSGERERRGRRRGTRGGGLLRGIGRETAAGTSGAVGRPDADDEEWPTGSAGGGASWRGAHGSEGAARPSDDDWDRSADEPDWPRGTGMAVRDALPPRPDADDWGALDADPIRPRHGAPGTRRAPAASDEPEPPAVGRHGGRHGGAEAASWTEALDDSTRQLGPALAEPPMSFGDISRRPAGDPPAGSHDRLRAVDPGSFGGGDPLASSSDRLGPAGYGAADRGLRADSFGAADPLASSSDRLGPAGYGVADRGLRSDSFGTGDPLAGSHDRLRPVDPASFGAVDPPAADGYGTADRDPLVPGGFTVPVHPTEETTRLPGPIAPAAPRQLAPGAHGSANLPQHRADLADATRRLGPRVETGPAGLQPIGQQRPAPVVPPGPGTPVPPPPVDATRRFIPAYEPEPPRPVSSGAGTHSINRAGEDYDELPEPAVVRRKSGGPVDPGAAGPAERAAAAGGPPRKVLIPAVGGAAVVVLAAVIVMAQGGGSQSPGSGPKPTQQAVIPTDGGQLTAPVDMPTPSWSPTPTRSRPSGTPTRTKATNPTGTATSPAHSTPTRSEGSSSPVSPTSGPTATDSGTKPPATPTG